jgi:hypothetical protein
MEWNLEVLASYFKTATTTPLQFQSAKIMYAQLFAVRQVK